MLTNNTDIILKSDVIEPFLDVNIRYHCPIVAIFQPNKYNQNTFKRTIWLYEQGDYPKYRQKISETDWAQIITPTRSIDQSATMFSTKLLDIASTCIPNKLINVRQGDIPWITSEIKRTMRKRDRLRRKAKKDNSIYLWSKFKTIRNKVVDLLRRAKRNYHESLCTKIKDHKFSNKDWWKLVKQLSNFNTKSNKLPALVDDDDNLVTDDLEKADLLNTFFTSQSTIDDSNGILPIYIDETVNKLENIVILENDVLNILKLLDPTKAVGHDHISPRLLKEGKNELALLLCTLFNLSLQQKVFPTDWKKQMLYLYLKKMILKK